MAGGRQNPPAIETTINPARAVRCPVDHNDQDKHVQPPFSFDVEFAGPADWARLYRVCGLQVVPAFMPGETKGPWKRPLLKDWRQYQNELVADDVFLPWYGPLGQYRQRPNMGVICGNASGNLFVVDLDLHKDARAGQWWRGLMIVHNNGMELESVEQRTGGGGLQILFRGPPGWTPPTCKTPIGVDIRGQGGFAMLAPSLHESGKAYEWLEGRSPDDIEILIAPDWLLEAVDALVVSHGGTSAPRHQTHPRSSFEAFDAFGHQTDGREELMRDLIWGSILDWKRECPIRPSHDESLAKEAEKYAVYEAQVSPRSGLVNLTKADQLDIEGRGPRLFHVKWKAAMDRWDDKVAEEAKQPGKSDNYRADDRGAKSPQLDPQTGQPIVYPYLDVDQILAMPDPVWMVDKLINEQSLGFVFGPPGSLKTFISLDLALSIAAGLPTWWDRAISGRGCVIYLCREGTRSLKFRIGAWQQHRKAKASGAPFYLIEQTINFMRPEDVQILLATVGQIAAKAGQPVRAVFVDTVSRVLPGAEENLQKDMSLFIAACEALQQAFGCVVIGVHHTNKNGTIRGSTVIPGAGDFLLETRREPGSMVGMVVVQKVKDGEDGQELRFVVEKVTLPGVVLRTSLVVDLNREVDAAAAARRAPGDGLPDITVCREILAALATAWFTKAPWGSADNSQRPAVRLIMARWSLKREPVRKLLDGWMANGIIEYATLDAKNKVHGYRKLVDL